MSIDGNYIQRAPVNNIDSNDFEYKLELSDKTAGHGIISISFS
mgnify:CR=1 FL=1